MSPDPFKSGRHSALLNKHVKTLSEKQQWMHGEVSAEVLSHVERPKAKSEAQAPALVQVQLQRVPRGWLVCGEPGPQCGTLGWCGTFKRRSLEGGS
jgi:hypothetical protein